jgi:hypothetical protein
MGRQFELYKPIKKASDIQFAPEKCLDCPLLNKKCSRNLAPALSRLQKEGLVATKVEKLNETENIYEVTIPPKMVTHCTCPTCHDHWIIERDAPDVCCQTMAELSDPAEKSEECLTARIVARNTHEIFIYDLCSALRELLPYANTDLHRMTIKL